MLHLRDFGSPAIFEFFNTIGAKLPHVRSWRWNGSGISGPSGPLMARNGPIRAGLLMSVNPVPAKAEDGLWTVGAAF